MNARAPLAEFIPTKTFTSRKLRLVVDTPAKPHYTDSKAYSAWQKVQQEAQLRANLAALGTPPSAADRAQLHQTLPTTDKSFAEMAALQGAKGFAFKL